MDKAEIRRLVQAWGRLHKILREIRDLAEINPALAYGLIRYAETMVDLIVVGRVPELKSKSASEIPEMKEAKG